MKLTYYKPKPTIATIQAAIVGYVRSGATTKQIVRLTGVSVLDVEAVIIENKLPLKPEQPLSLNVSINAIRYSALEFGYLQCEKGENIQAAFLNYNKIINP